MANQKETGADTRFIQPTAHVLVNGRSAMVVRRDAGRVRVEFLDGTQGVYALAEIKHPLSSDTSKGGSK